jgi:hypothetical protein
MPKQAGSIYYRLLEATPFGNELTLAAAAQILEHEQLGEDDAPDILCVGLSANDYVGHAFGPHSLEVQDITLRTDLQLAAFVKLIDSKLNGAPWVFVLSSDHGVAPVPEIAAMMKIPAARNPLGDAKSAQDKIEERLRRELGTPSDGKSYIQHVDYSEIYLQTDLPELAGERLTQAQEIVRSTLLEQPAVADAHTRRELLAAGAGEGLFEQFRLAFNPKRSGEVLFVLLPYMVQGKNTATHGSPWSYDSHVPLVFLGAGIRPGLYDDKVSPGAMAPTLARLLGVESPAQTAVAALVDALQ